MARPMHPFRQAAVSERIISYCKTVDDFEYAFIRSLWEFGYREMVVAYVVLRDMNTGGRVAIAEILTGKIKAPKGAPPQSLELEKLMREFAKNAEAKWELGLSREQAIGEVVDDLNAEGVVVTDDQIARALDKLRAETPELREKIDRMIDNPLARMMQQYAPKD